MRGAKQITAADALRAQLSFIVMPSNSTPHRIHLELLTGQFWARIAEFWFKYLGYTAIAAGLSIAASEEEGWLLDIAKWISYGALYLWLRHQAEKCFYYIWPDLVPAWGYSPKTWHMFMSNTLAVPLAFVAYLIALRLAKALGV